MCGLFEEKCACICFQTKNCLSPIGPDAQLGIVPQRMPAITWREERQSDPGYALLDINPLTGEQRYLGLRLLVSQGVTCYLNRSCLRPMDKDYSSVLYFKEPGKAMNDRNWRKAA